VAEEANADAYRDLLHEIDRAFDGFDRSAVRHGWMADHGLNAGAAQIAAAAEARRRSRAVLGHIDLPDFVAAVAAEIGGSADGRGVLQLPADWLAGLDDLPGFDRERRVLLHAQPAGFATNRVARWRFSVAHEGLIRRAISRVQSVPDAEWDNRVSVARTDAGAASAVLLTFCAEMRSAVHTEFQRIIAVLLPEVGDAEEMREHERWLQLATSDRSRPVGGVWQDLFARWVPRRQWEAESTANAMMRRDVAKVLDDRRQRVEREATSGERLLHVPMTSAAHSCRRPAIFGAAVVGPSWRSLSDPLDRLAAFAADADNLPVGGAKRTVQLSCSNAVARTIRHARHCLRQFCI
jgi:hypothetical protein